jgi:hypothetical protein
MLQGHRVPIMAQKLRKMYKRAYNIQRCGTGTGAVTC